jgi:hypothetical protein
MPRQNRVTPMGKLIATPARGLLMGNRGRLHNQEQQIIKHSNSKLWIFCQLEFKNRKREIMSPNAYTELFFLDEATALSAGHRPCGECFHSKYKSFVSHWKQTNGVEGTLTSKKIDEVLHLERIRNKDQKVTLRENIDALPDGCFIKFDNENDYYLIVRLR